MKDNKLLMASVMGTSLMTLFSYVISGKEGKNFSEPKLLSGLLKDALPRSAKDAALPVGWATHYAIGVMFTCLYQSRNEQVGRKPGILNGLVFGAVSGAVGVVGWKAAFAMHPAPPRTHYAKFYNQLFVAHLVFGATVSLTEKMINKALE